jgi:arsenate reductase-like glutaredoxin family protein
MSVIIYGIKNGDTMKKARAWLGKRGAPHVFHDYKTAGIERERLKCCAKKIGRETLRDRAGTTFRKSRFLRHARPCAGHPRLTSLQERRGWPGQARP